MATTKFGRLWRAWRRGASSGEIAILKADAFGVRTPVAAEGKLDRVHGFLPDIDMPSLRALPDGTLGREWARLLDAQGYAPFDLPPELKAEVIEQTFMVRYIATHDVMHVLTGFDTSYAGEMGVLSFTVAQGFAPGGRTQELAATLLYPLFAPSQRAAIRTNRRVGRAMGEASRFLLGERWEDRLEARVEDLRAEFGVPDPEAAGVISELLGRRDHADPTDARLAA